MRVQKITNTQISDIELNTQITEKSIRSNKISDAEIKKQSINFSPDALLKTLDILENNKQMDNSHPLKKSENAPIESFEEALIELSYFKSPFFKVNASAAQANMKNEDVLYLFK